MSRIFARNLRDKQVMSSDGRALGVLYNIVMDFRTGNIIELVVKPDIGLNKSKYKVEDEFVLIPFSAVRAITDNVVVDKNLSLANPKIEAEA